MMPATLLPNLAQVWLVIEPIDMRAGIDGLSQRIQERQGRTPCDGSGVVCALALTNPACPLRVQRLRLPQPAPEPAQAPDLGWHRRLALPAPPASGPFHLAPS